ncbi:hypothetical protein LCGC14_0456930 [marine sediment metagenome]|uniref:Uncharacterized protein n=1 Tax=marine sediment metagenome TaxID=412755 RepID=A0A0F9V325_9ZZZZ|nr:hypothetical protein [Candidatus Aminicenantes bacterium]
MTDYVAGANYLKSQREDKDSAIYFMTEMTQEEFEERMGDRLVRASRPYKFNRIKRAETEEMPC